LLQTVVPLTILCRLKLEYRICVEIGTYENQKVSLLIVAAALAAEVGSGGKPVPEGPVSGAKT
jgi:hypothetical protein